MRENSDLWLKQKGFIIYLIVSSLLWGVILFPAIARAGEYADSTHGNSSYGVKRNSLPTDYITGNCAHCHEQHASIGGIEPAPVAGEPSPNTLFYTNHTWQDDNFCFKCHDASTNIASNAIVNRSYSYRAGGWTADSISNIKNIFNLSSGSAHNLNDIKNFLNNRWGYTSTNNPCSACHNPHAAQGDPANAPNTTKNSGSRGYPVSRPSQHGDLPTWGLWGNDSGEQMNYYTSNYQAPFRYNSSSSYEPDGSTSIDDGSNLTDINNLCIDCHNTSNIIYSTALGRNLRYIDWTYEKHGKGNADEYISVDLPYTAGGSALGYVLACTDCHEPHGSPNVFLLRQCVNGNTLTANITSPTSTNMRYLCARCHDDNNQNIHHYSTDKAYLKIQCIKCHYSYPIRCSDCHFHGSWVNDPANDRDQTPSYAPQIRKTF